MGCFRKKRVRNVFRLRVSKKSVVFIFVISFGIFLTVFFGGMVSAESAHNGGERPWKRFFSQEELQITIDPLERMVLNNGIPVYLKQNRMLPKVTVTFFLEGGVFEEAEGEEGLTALWGSTLAYSGSENLPARELATYMEKRASSFYFDSGLERSSFTLSSLSHFFYDDLLAVFDVMMNPLLADADYQLMRNQSLQGIKRRTERPGAMAYLGAKLIFWEGDVRSRIPTTSSLESMERDTLVEKHSSMMRASRFSILIVGDFLVDELMDHLNETFGSLEASQEGMPDVSLLEGEPLERDSRLLVHMAKDIPQTTVLWRAPGVPHASPDYYALKVFDFILGGDSFNSTLTAQIRTRRGWAYSVYSHYSAGKYGGDLSIFLQTKNDSAADAVAEVERILSNPDEFLTEERLSEAVMAIKNKYVFLYETPEKLASLQLALQWDGLPDDYLEHFLEHIDQVSLDDLKRIARQYYAPEKFFLTVVGPDQVADEINNNIQSREKNVSSKPVHVVDFKIPL